MIILRHFLQGVCTALSNVSTKGSPPKLKLVLNTIGTPVFLWDFLIKL